MDRRVIVLGLGIVGIALGGCKSVSEEDYQAAIDENSQLRERVASLQESVREANDEMSRAQADCEDRLDAQRASLMAQQQPTQQPAANTGFEGIEGVQAMPGGGGSVVVAVAGDVLFPSGKAELRTTSKASLDRIAGVIASRYQGQLIRVEGYTDSDQIRKSGWASNEQLSSERALAVESYLVGKGVDNDRIYSASFGPSNPKETKEASRRVEIVILGQG